MQQNLAGGREWCKGLTKCQSEHFLIPLIMLSPQGNAKFRLNFILTYPSAKLLNKVNQEKT